MSVLQKSDSNIDKLSFKEQLKLLFFKPDQFLNLFQRQTNRPDSTITYSTDDVQKRSYEELSRLSSVELTHLFDDQVSHLEKGAVDISKKIDSIKAKDPQNNIKETTLETGNMQVGETKTIQENDRNNDAR